MVLPQINGIAPVHGIRLSSVSSSKPSEPDTIHELTGLDIIMKLHYLKAVYIFSSEAACDLTVAHVKEGMFTLFDQFFWAIGRVRRHDSGRPYIKCNDSGSRFVEGHCDFTVEEWLHKPDRSVDEFLVYHKPVGPELAFSPLVYIQMTRFKCGGLSLGLSWAHILGDPFSLPYAFNQSAHTISGIKLSISRASAMDREFQAANPVSIGKDPDFIKRVDPVGDLWVTPNSKKMATFSFSLTVSQLSPYYPAKALTGNSEDRIPVFETLCGVIWKCIAREHPNPDIITIVRRDPKGLKPRTVRNGQVISSVRVDFPVADADLEDLVSRIAEPMDVMSQIDEIGNNDAGVLDFVVYGARLTFVDMSEVDFYGVKLMDHPPESVYYGIEGIGDDGTVVFLPATMSDGRVVTVTLPEERMERVKSELKKCGIMATSENGA